MNNSTTTTTTTERIKRLQDHLSSQYVDFDLETTTDRLHSLYSDFFKLKTLNPYGYDANVNYWRAVILDCNLHGYLTSKDYACFIDKKELPELFNRPGKGKPISLDCVISDMTHITRDLMTQHEYEKKYPISNSTYYSITSNSLLSPLSSWFQHWLYNYTPYRWLIPETPTHLFIVLPTIQEYCKIIIQKHYQKPLCSSLNNLFTFHEFREEYGTISCHQETIIQLKDMDLWLVLRYLSYHYGVALGNTQKTFGSSCTIIKFPDRNEAELAMAVISDNDKAIINLKMACSTLHKQADELQVKSEEFHALSKTHYESKRKPQAIYMLKKKKKIEELLEHRLKTLETLETMLLKIEASQNDLQVIQAFNIGADTLRSLLNNKDLDVNNIDKTMEKVQVALENQKEVEEAIAIGNEQVTNSVLPADMDDEELEKELNLLRLGDEPVNLTQPIDTESELLRLQNVLASLNHPVQSPLSTTKEARKARERELA